MTAPAPPPGYKTAHVRVVADEITGRAQVLEIGAGLGVVTAALARRVRSVWAYEPIPALAAAARTRCAGHSQVRIVEAAIGPPACSDTVTLHEMSEPWNSGVHPVPYDVPVAEVVAACRPINEAVTSADADTIVLDCEGAEVDLLAHHMPDQVTTLMVEWHPHIMGEEAVDLTKMWLADDQWVPVRIVSGELRPGGFAELVVYRR